MNQKGKLTFSGILIIILVLYGAYAAVIYISAGITESQIAKEVKDTIGMIRGGDFTSQKGIDTITNILKKKDIILEEEDIQAIDVILKPRQIEYYFTYEIEMNFLFFSKYRRVETEDHMASYD